MPMAASIATPAIAPPSSAPPALAMSTPVAATVTASPAAAAANANPTQDFQSALASVLQTPVALSGTTVPGDATLAAAGRVGIAAPSTTAKPSGAKLPHMPAATEAGAEAPSPTATAMPLPDALPSPLVPSLPSSNLPVNLVLRDAEADGAESTPAAPGKAATQAAPQAAATEAPPEPAAPTHGLGSNTADPMIASLPQAGIETFSHHLAAPVGASPSVGADPAPAASPAAPTSHASAPAVPMQLANANATPTATTQVGAAFVVVTRQGEAAPSLTLHLQPPDLGRVAINIEQPKESGAKISLTVEQPETLLMLMRDQPALHKALDSAGIAAEGRTLSFHMASAEGIAPAAASSQPQDSGSSLSNGSNGQGQGAGAQAGMGDHGGRNSTGSQARQTSGTANQADPTAGFSFTPSQPVARLLPRSAVDITA